MRNVIPWDQMSLSQLEFLLNNSGCTTSLRDLVPFPAKPGATMNLWWGCEEVSPGCWNCYARETDKRKLHDPLTHWGHDAPRLMASENYWAEPHKWNRQAEKAGLRMRVMCGSMCDVMERRADLDLDTPRQRLYKLIEETPHLDWMFFTKRPHEYKNFLPKSWLKSPRPNVWLLTTVENQDYIWRIEEMMKVPAVVYGISVEPMLGPVTLPATFLALGKTAWVINGGESGHQARPAQINWFREMRDQCVSAGVPYFFKQSGTHNSDFIQIGKKKSGRELDGREWNEYPVPLTADKSQFLSAQPTQADNTHDLSTLTEVLKAVTQNRTEDHCTRCHRWQPLESDGLCGACRKAEKRDPDGARQRAKMSKLWYGCLTNLEALHATPEEKADFCVRFGHLVKALGVTLHATGANAKKVMEWPDAKEFEDFEQKVNATQQPQKKEPQAADEPIWNIFGDGSDEEAG